MPREFPRPLMLGKIAANAGRQRGGFDEAGNMAIVEPFRTNMAAMVDDAAKQRPVGDPREFKPRLKRHDRACEVGRAASDLDLAPTGLAAHSDQETLVQELDLACAVLGLPVSDIEAGDFRAA